MAETTKIELVTPSQVMIAKSADMVVVPGSEGCFGVLPRHSALLANLQRGIIDIYENDKITDRIMIDGGIADVTAEGVTILTPRAENLNTASSQELNGRAQIASAPEADFLKAVIAAL